jgi:hypothetical protein
MDPMLSLVPTAKQIELFAAFAERVRDGHCGNRTRVHTATVPVVALLCAIGKSFEMDGWPNPTYHSKGKYWLQMEQLLIEAYQCHDLLAQQELAVSVSLVKYLQDLCKTSSLEKVKTVCDMSTIAFYYLLQGGKYTGHCKKDCQCTKQFRACNIMFYDCSHTIIPNTEPLATLYTTAKAAM